MLDNRCRKCGETKKAEEFRTSRRMRDRRGAASATTPRACVGGIGRASLVAEAVEARQRAHVEALRAQVRERSDDRLLAHERRVD